MKKILVLTALFIAATLISRATDLEEMLTKNQLDSLRKAADSAIYMPSYYGAYVHFNYNMHSGNFSQLPGVPNCCPEFASGSGLGAGFGALYEIPFTSSFSAYFRAGYSMLNGSFSETETTTLYDAANDDIMDGEFEHSLDAGLGAVILEPAAVYNITENLKLNLGLQAGFLVSKSYEQQEEITKPSDRATFLNPDGTDSRRRIRNDVSGDIEEANGMQFGMAAGLSYDIFLNKNKTTILAPEIFYSFNFSSILPDDDWNVSSLRAGVAIKFAPEPPPLQVIRQNENIDTVEVELKTAGREFVELGNISYFIDTTYVYDPVSERDVMLITNTTVRTDTKHVQPALAAEIKAYGLDKKDKLMDNLTITVDEYVTASRNFPLLNYIFFDDGKSNIPDRYRKISGSAAENFYEEKLDTYETMPIYYDMLNIFGRRLKQYSNTSITLTALNSITSGNKGDKELAGKRAEAISDYFVTVWGIDSDRIKIRIEDIKSAKNPSPEKTEENNRVEIRSESWDIMKPLFKGGDTLREVTPSVVRFVPKVLSTDGLAGWELDIEQQRKQLKKFEQFGDIPKQIDWLPNNDKKSTPKNNQQLVYRLKVTDKTGNTLLTEDQSLPVKYTTIREKQLSQGGDKLIEKYNLILFDLDKSDIKGANMNIVDFIKGRIKPDSEVKITGYTDKLGSADYNIKLSEARAASTEKALGIKTIETKGVGGSEELFDNKLPEGRFYCRTVQVVIETPIKIE